MAKGASFRRGTSGSPKHTEVTGGVGYDSGHIGDEGPRIGAGVMGGRVRPEYDRRSMMGKEDGSPGHSKKLGGKMSVISQGE